MFSFINNLMSLVLLLIIGIPFLLFVAYMGAGFAQGLFGGSTWLWMTIFIVFGIGAAAEDYNKSKSKQSSTD